MIVRLALIEMVKLAEVLIPFESVPDKEKLNVPAAVGVPETTVPPPVNERPPGSAPVASTALEMAPVKTNGCEYEVPTMPPGVAKAMIGTGETWLLTRVDELDPFASVAVMVKLPVLVEFATPERTPDPAPRVAPAGSDPPVIAYVTGAVPPVATYVELKD